MAPPTKRTWERVTERMLDWGGYALLAIGTALGLSAGDADPGWRVGTLGLAALAAVWLLLGWTRRPAPDAEHRLRLDAFFAGLLVLAAILMLRQPLFFVFMIAGFFYATALRPMPLAVVGVFATSVLVNTLIAGVPRNPEAWTFWVVLIAIQTTVIGAGAVGGEKLAEQNEERRVALVRLEAALEENAGLHRQLLAQAREAGVLDERERMASEIHDTIAQGLTGIITQLEAADQARERPEDRDRHLANAQRLARDSLKEARRSVEASMPAALETRTLPEALRGVVDEWSGLSGVPVEVTLTGAVIALHPDIEVALLRTAQEALANVAKHAGAEHAWLTLSYMGDVVTLDVRDDGVGFTPASAPGGSQPDGPAARTDAGGFGLIGMRQRIARVAGSLAIESEPGGGTAVSARVPAIAAGSGGPAA